MPLFHVSLSGVVSCEDPAVPPAACERGLFVRGNSLLSAVAVAIPDELDASLAVCGWSDGDEQLTFRSSDKFNESVTTMHLRPDGNDGIPVPVTAGRFDEVISVAIVKDGSLLQAAAEKAEIVTADERAESFARKHAALLSGGLAGKKGNATGRAPNGQKTRWRLFDSAISEELGFIRRVGQKPMLHAVLPDFLFAIFPKKCGVNAFEHERRSA